MNEFGEYEKMVESIAMKFHTVYAANAPYLGEPSEVPWEDVPAAKKTLLMSVIDDLLMSGVIRSDLGAGGR